MYSAGKRSEIMSKIGSKDTKPEILVRKILFSQGFRFRKNDKRFPGTPDIVLPKYKCIIFVHGCFWHGHQGCKKSKLPETRKDFWMNKINGNLERDKNNIYKLEGMGWRVFVIWGCSLINDTNEVIYKLNNIK
jgi:DNA mismatch endonuclease (patch repair protein)